MTGTAKDFVQLLRVYKHDYLNHLQVLLGYLQLKKPELALDYAREAIEEIQENGTIMRLGLPKLTIWLLLKRMQLEERGITLTLQNETDFAALECMDEELLEWFKAVEDVISLKLNSLPVEAQGWEICFDGSGPYEIVFNLPILQDNPWPGCLEPCLARLAGGITATWSSNEQKFALKLLIPTNLCKKRLNF
ncbi:Spo0B domain-containing protein [Zhaonella formicivorans]|uniref:Spo0B domain-containing protein n=1 Tax=Zhaonella formicivorans TaxID=2528593 RepID=UPI001D112DF8|nr:Spo0B domain-containing protein [Zhaonella formicivorans]